MSLVKGLLVDSPILKGLLFGGLAVFLLYWVFVVAMLRNLHATAGGGLTAVAGGGSYVMRSPVFLVTAGLVFIACLYFAAR